MSCKIEEGRDIMKTRLNNEEGYMIVVVLMILSILTVIATAGTNNSITEQRSATNEQIHEQHRDEHYCERVQKVSCIVVRREFSDLEIPERHHKLPDKFFKELLLADVRIYNQVLVEVETLLNLFFLDNCCCHTD